MRRVSILELHLKYVYMRILRFEMMMKTFENK